MRWIARGVLWGGAVLALGACGQAPIEGDVQTSDMSEEQAELTTLRHPRSFAPVRVPVDSSAYNFRVPDGKPGDGSDGSDATDGSDLQCKAESEQEECDERETLKVAIEGRRAPHTGGLRFDSMGQGQGFRYPMINDHGDVAFIATYGQPAVPELQAPETDATERSIPSGGYGPGTGVFAYDADDEHDQLRAIALAGQHTEVGTLPRPLPDWGPLALNDHDQIVFSVRNIGTDDLVERSIPGGVHARSAIFEGNVEDHRLKVLVRQGQPAPGGGFFDEFFNVSLNDRGDVAFLASIVNDTGANFGIFLKKHDCDELEKIVRVGDPLYGGYGGTLCGEIPPGGPWLNNDDIVLFQANCISEPTVGLPGSVFIKKPRHEIQPFVRVGEDPPDLPGGPIVAIAIGQPGVNDDEAAMQLVIANPPTSGTLIASKKLEYGDGFDICAIGGQSLGDGFNLGLVPGDGPSIAEDGIIAFNGRVDNSTARNGSFICKDQRVSAVALEGDRKPVGDYFQYGELFLTSNDDRHSVFVDVTQYPTGVFSAKTCKPRKIDGPVYTPEPQ